MFKNMTIGMKITLGFGMLIVILIILSSIAVVNMKSVTTESEKLAFEYVPEVSNIGEFIFVIDRSGNYPQCISLSNLYTYICGTTHVLNILSIDIYGKYDFRQYAW